MNTIAKLIQILFPLIALLLLIIGIKKRAIYYMISALWLSLIAMLIHLQFSGNQIFGTYFNYYNASIYTSNLLILLITLIYVISHLSTGSTLRYVYSFVNAFLVVIALVSIINLWMNAFFIENKMEGTPIIQVALINKPDYCKSKYVFYKVNIDTSIMYLCPNYYGLIPSLGRLAVSPDFVAAQLPLSIRNQILLKHKKE
ncbi:type I secretion system protein LssZ [Legionella longbeachae]|uniref:Legionella secretion system protein Z n=1 Tax=Legionella longbeachae serogroup 1 (strain NSW150) TaxID=661367 RepID=D3HTA5_LEGLN|nr:type I secretion system protein LssZ [Legionella longbeachae]VEE02638.1 Legionella secretion system protein Z [Legionella oakridgensis]HBD7397901.1 type I secretion system protein LssZ [Legionella pneumophila]ARB91095.1 type I secretion system protein LssZ [Legionella longbeachae]ARM32477.1 type I secretion system protein LssZ [Legionella longbeachae]EEZ94711.1 Legionella secretion system protein Z [Legionella longbeachae D-4968]